MSEAQIQEIYRRLGTLDMVTALADEVAAQREDIRQVKSDVAEILRILRDGVTAQRS